MRSDFRSEVLLASAGLDNTVCTWSLPSVTRSRSFPCSKGSVGSVGFSTDGRYLSVGCYSQIYVFDRESSPGNVFPAYSIHEDCHSSAINTIGHFSSRRSMIYTAGDDGSARIWDLAERKLSQKVQVPSRVYHCIPLSPDRCLSSLLLATGEGIVHWDIQANATTTTDPLPSTPSIIPGLPPVKSPYFTKLSLCYELLTLVAGLSDGRVVLYKLPETSSFTNQWKGPFIFDTKCRFVSTVTLASFPAFTGKSNSSAVLSIGGLHGEVAIYNLSISSDIDSPKLFSMDLVYFTPSPHCYSILDSLCTFDGEHVFTADTSGKVCWYKCFDEEGLFSPSLLNQSIRHSDQEPHMALTCLSMTDVYRR
ncbi:hypothetical protein GEMRC1_002191 [Eukaryota sp. GEM-RC1]